MGEVYAVIGAGFGDEGKGRAVDHVSVDVCSSDLGTVVVRYSGGAQAGHTVDIGDGIRHVFHHFGSGTLNGNRTHLTGDFIFNPMLMAKERRELETLIKRWNDIDAYNPVKSVDNLTVTASGHCSITTPVDMLINEIVETHRGDARHGSCGVGIFETVNRTTHAGGLNLVGALGKSPQELIEYALSLAEDWTPVRLEHLGIDPKDYPVQMEYMRSREIATSWALDLTGCLSRIEVISDAVMGERIRDYDLDVIYEGSQGLLLDQGNTDFFPHLTPAHVGSKGILRAVRRGMPLPGEVIYVTRTYMTRHGAGPFPTENSELRYADETNSPNAWQGSLRYGDLDVDLLKKAILRDKLLYSSTDRPTFSLFSTCHDQHHFASTLWSSDHSIIARALDVNPRFYSYGPDSNLVGRA